MTNIDTYQIFMEVKDKKPRLSNLQRKRKKLWSFMEFKPQNTGELNGQNPQPYARDFKFNKDAMNCI